MCIRDSISSSPNKIFSENLRKLQQDFMVVKFLDERAGRKIDVCTGNWGCGIFNGDLQLKLMIQWLAASLAQRNIIYCSFGQPIFDGDMQAFMNKIRERTMAQNLKDVLQFGSTNFNEDLFTYLLSIK
eukprot:TRINITY_DN7378_c0_g1_i10.p3 TRINITY_DN7378_c0_g1~~TRINITY_DN7378_c0_g1_i10.p3  ORF type:complete len:128 (-),score=17.31 TRINITY_DN7378_c0_g1_i10:246-629(-)